MDMLGSACWLPRWEKDNHKNTKSGKNYSMLLRHLHQTHGEAKFQHRKTESSTTFWSLFSDGSFACRLVRPACSLLHGERSARGTARLSDTLQRAACYLDMEQALLCRKDPLCRTLAVKQHRRCDSLLRHQPCAELGCEAHSWNVPFSSLLCHNASVFLGRGIFPSSILPYNEAKQTKRYQAPEHQGGEYTHILRLSRL